MAGQQQGLPHEQFWMAGQRGLPVTHVRQVQHFPVIFLHRVQVVDGLERHRGKILAYVLGLVAVAAGKSWHCLQQRLFMFVVIDDLVRVAQDGAVVRHAAAHSIHHRHGAFADAVD